jgi:hypothetical protein
MDNPDIWYLLGPVILVTGIFAAVAVRDIRRKQIVERSPICSDCRHAKYLSSHEHRDQMDWGIKWSSDSGYYCALSEYRISSGGAAVTGFDKKRMIKCKRYRETKCGPAAKLFEAEDQRT